LEEKGTEPDKLSDLQELGAQGWKNVATGAKVANAASTALTIGSIAAAPFTGGLSLTGLGAAAALKGATKVGTTVAAKGATKMATKAAATAATKQATKTATQKGAGVAGRIGTDVATYGAINKMSGSGKPKQDTTTQIEPNKIQQNTSPLARIGVNSRIGANTPAQQNRGKLAASYDPEGTELLEILGKVLMKGGKVINKQPKLTPLPGRTPGRMRPITRSNRYEVQRQFFQTRQRRTPSRTSVSTGNPATPPGNVSTSAGNAAAKPEPGMLKKVGGSAANAAMTAGAFTLMTPKQQVDKTAQIQNPTGTARDR